VAVDRVTSFRHKGVRIAMEEVSEPQVLVVSTE